MQFFEGSASQIISKKISAGMYFLENIFLLHHLSMDIVIFSNIMMFQVVIYRW